MAFFQCGLIAVISEHNIAAWSLKSTIRLVAALYAVCTVLNGSIRTQCVVKTFEKLCSMIYYVAYAQGVVCSGLTFSITSWIIQRKGPLYVSIFTPLLLIIVAIVSWTLLHEQLYVGTCVSMHFFDPKHNRYQTVI